MVEKVKAINSASCVDKKGEEMITFAEILLSRGCNLAVAKVKTHYKLQYQKKLLTIEIQTLIKKTKNTNKRLIEN